MDPLASWIDIDRIRRERDDGQVARYASRTAAVIAFFGNVAAGTEIISLLRETELESFPKSFPDAWTKACFYFAWEVTGSWPPFIPEPERQDQFLTELDHDTFEGWGSDLDLGQDADQARLDKALDVAQDCDSGFADAETGWDAMRRSQALTVAFDTALRMGETERAKEILERICRRLKANCQLEYLVCLRLGWTNAFLDSDGPIRRCLEGEVSGIEAAAGRFIDALRTRLQNGPARPYAHMSIADLVATIDSNTRRYGAYQEYFNKDPPSTICRSGVSQSALSNLESRLDLSAPLSQDYKEFMTLTNGSGAVWTGYGFHEFIGPIDTVTVGNRESFVVDWRLVLLPLNRNTNSDPPFEWPLLERLIHLNPSDTEGETWLVEPKYVAHARDMFFRTVYESADAVLRRKLDALIAQVYGSMQEFRQLEWALLRWEFWNPVDQPFNGIRGLLEVLAEESGKADDAQDV